MRILIYTVFIFPFILTECSWPNTDKTPPEPTLPPETQIGANTFGCRVDGKIWEIKPNNNPGQDPLPADYNGSAIYVLADGHGSSIKFDIFSGVTELGEYALYQSNNGRAYYALWHPTISTYYTDSLVNGILTMTRLDLQNSIISGRFYFNAVNHLGDTVRITDGRFDIKYR